MAPLTGAFHARETVPALTPATRPSGVSGIVHTPGPVVSVTSLEAGPVPAALLACTRMVALIGPDQRIKSLSFADSYWRAHDELHKSGDIDHGAADCPERGAPRAARVWTSTDGWQGVTASPEPASQ